MKKKLYRSNNNKFVAGVLGGLAEYFEQDPTFWRLGFALFLIVTGFFPGALMYVVAWVLIPLKPLVEEAPKADYTVYQ